MNLGFSSISFGILISRFFSKIWNAAFSTLGTSSLVLNSKNIFFASDLKFEILKVDLLFLSIIKLAFALLTEKPILSSLNSTI